MNIFHRIKGYFLHSQFLELSFQQAEQSRILPALHFLFCLSFLRQASPWGQGFEEPVFYGDFELVEQKIVGEKHLKCNLKLVGTNSVLEGIAFFQEKLKSKKARVAYKLNVNSFRGNESLQLMIESIESA